MHLNKKHFRFIGTIAFTILGVFIVPHIVKKMGVYFYKISLKRDEIDFDNLGPEIVPKDQERKRIRRRRWSNKYGN